MMNSDTHRTSNSVLDAFNAEAGRTVVLNAKIESEYSINHLKEEINKVVWMFAASQTTLKEADDLACQILELFVRNREVHGAIGEFDG